MFDKMALDMLFCENFKLQGLSPEIVTPDAALRRVHVATGSRHIVNVPFLDVSRNLASSSGHPRGNTG